MWPGGALSPLVVRQHNASGAPSVEMPTLGAHPDGEIYSLTEAPILCDVNRDGQVDLVAQTNRRTGLSGFTFSGVEVFYGPGLLVETNPEPDAWFTLTAGQRVTCGNSGIVVADLVTAVLIPSRGL